MTFDELTYRIDKEISEKKEHGKNLWFDHDIDMLGLETN